MYNIVIHMERGENMLIYDEKAVLEGNLFNISDTENDQILYFDIETTGFAPASTILYLIGCVYMAADGYHIRQWFADTADSEAGIITSFLEFVKKFRILVHYNGTGFDIPYIIKKCDIYGIECDLSGIESLDIYKKINHMKTLLKLENLKQKSVENFLGIGRTDKYTGGELISIYHNYLKAPNDEMKRLLLLHNHDDITGMVKILPILNYAGIPSEQYNLVSIELQETVSITGAPKTEVVIELALDKFLPKRFSIGNKHYYLTACANTARLSIAAHTDELKYFYPNYKDYYYLPGEDRSIHKSVAFYVDKNFRTKAKAANCYSKKTGIFLPQYEELFNPYFKIDYYDKITYFEFTDDFKESEESILRYCNHIIRTLS